MLIKKITSVFLDYISGENEKLWTSILSDDLFQLFQTVFPIIPVMVSRRHRIISAGAQYLRYGLTPHESGNGLPVEGISPVQYQ